MADEFLLADEGFLSVVRAGSENLKDSDFEVVTLSVGSDIALVGEFVTHASETAPNVDLAVTSDASFVGVIVRPLLVPSSSWDIDTALIDGTDVVVLKPTGGRCTIAVYREPTAGPVAVVKGDIAVLGTADKGMVRKFIYADATAATDSFVEVVGKFAEAHAGHASENRIVLLDY